MSCGFEPIFDDLNSEEFRDTNQSKICLIEKRLNRVESIIKKLIKRRIQGCQDCIMIINSNVKTIDEHEEMKSFQINALNNDIALYEKLLSKMGFF